MGIKVYRLRPRHLFVPWILIENKYTAQNEKMAFNNLMEFVCDNYRVSKNFQFDYEFKKNNAKKVLIPF
jgi:hypothetical protein